MAMCSQILIWGNFTTSTWLKGLFFTISAAQRESIIDYGVLDVDSSCHLTGFLEKPRRNYLVSMGIYAINRSVLDYVPIGRRYGFDDLMNDMLALGLVVNVQPYAGQWLDIGRPDDYMQAIDIFEQEQSRFLRGAKIAST